MALNTNVTKVRVRKAMDKLFAITLNLSYLDGVEELFNKNFSQYHRTGNPAVYTVNKFLVKMQAAIDDYKAEQALYNSAALTNAITTLENNLEV